MKEAEGFHRRAALPFLSNSISRPFHLLLLRQLFLHRRHNPVSPEIQLDSHLPLQGKYAYIKRILKFSHDLFPNRSIIFTNCRIYTGFIGRRAGTVNLNPESCRSVTWLLPPLGLLIESPYRCVDLPAFFPAIYLGAWK